MPVYRVRCTWENIRAVALSIFMMHICIGACIETVVASCCIAEQWCKRLAIGATGSLEPCRYKILLGLPHRVRLQLNCNTCLDNINVPFLRTNAVPIDTSNSPSANFYHIFPFRFVLYFCGFDMWYPGKVEIEFSANPVLT